MGKALIRRFFEELKRRRVIAVVTWYVLATWVLLQVADVLGPVLTGGDEALRFVVWVAVLGFPLALFLGWRYDFTGGHMVRTQPAHAGDRTPLGMRDFALLGVMAAAAVALGVFAFRQAGEAPVVEAIGAPNSVAVLRIEDQTGSNKALAEELSDQLVSTLIANENLRVIGRESSFYFADHPTELPQIATMLDARHLLTGSISGEPDAPRLRFELLAMPTGDVAWADDIALNPEQPWLIYGQVGNDVAEALGVAIVTGGGSGARNAELETLLRRADQAEGEGKFVFLDQAAALAPDDPRPWVERAFAIHRLITIRDWDYRTEMPKHREALDRARERGADGYRYHWAEGMYHRRMMLPALEGVTPAREQQMLDHLNRAIALNPSDAMPYLSLSIHHRRQRRFFVAGDLLRRSLERDPLYGGARMHYSRILSALGRKDDAYRWITQVPALFNRYWEDAYLRHLEFNDLDRAIWWLQRWPDKGPAQRYWLAENWAKVKVFDEARAIHETLDEGPEGHASRSTLAYWDSGNDPEVLLVANLAELDENVPDQRQEWALILAAGSAASVGQHELAVSLIDRAAPGFLDPIANPVQESNAGIALLLANSLRQLGTDPVREGILTSQLLGLWRGRPVLGFDGIGDGLVQIHAYRGDIDQAIALLESAVDEGFRDLYDSMGNMAPTYANLLDDPRFQALKARIDEDLVAMGEQAKQWIADGTDLMGPPPTELARLSETLPASP